MRRHIQRIRSLPPDGGWDSGGAGQYVGHMSRSSGAALASPCPNGCPRPLVPYDGALIGDLCGWWGSADEARDPIVPTE